MFELLRVAELRLSRAIIIYSKALELAQKRVARDVGAFGGAIYECTHINQYVVMHLVSAILNI